MDDALEFDFSHSGLRERITEVARSLGFAPVFDDDDIELWWAGDLFIACDDYSFEINAYAALESAGG